MLVPAELLQQVLGHVLVGQALRHRVAQQVRVDMLPDRRDRHDFLDDLLGVAGPRRGGQRWDGQHAHAHDPSRISIIAGLSLRTPQPLDIDVVYAGAVHGAS